MHTGVRTLQGWAVIMDESVGSMAGRREVLRLEGLRKSYNPGTSLETEVLHGLDLRLQEGDLAALIGPSGSGKSTLLNLIGLLDTPSGGELYLLGQATRAMDDDNRTRLRNESIGFVFQFHHLVNAFSVLDNVLMPLMIRRGKPEPADVELALGLLREVGLEAFAAKKPSQLSGGQQQRVAIARALVTRPALLLADEPTGNLDTKTAESVFELFGRLNRDFGCAVLVVTHDPRLAARCARTITLVDGSIVSDAGNPDAPASLSPSGT
ncbi:MAG: ABC-type antimicrobial peptide transport system, ATPase component [Moraxellaceae bacterium]|nr:ABC-type antimicrobial peptide transport system, ATPase component [Moraxellaceae bacterium]